MTSEGARDAFGELLIRRIRDPQVAEALARAEALGDDGTEAIAAIDRLLADVLRMLEEPALGEPGAWRSVPLRLLVGAPTNGHELAASPDDLVDLAATGDGLVGDLVGWIERFSAFPQAPAFTPGRRLPSDDLAFRRAVRGIIRGLVAGTTTHPALAGFEPLALPPAGSIVPELRESRSPDGRPCWIGAVRLYRQSEDGRVPIPRIAWLEVLENADRSIDARLLNVLEAASADAPFVGQPG